MAILSDINVRYNGHSNRKFYVDILAIAFGISSWISINGLWVELPLLVEQLPESWTLASYLSIIVQFANLGPLTVGLLRWICHEKIPIAWIIVGKNSFIFLSMYLKNDKTLSLGCLKY